MAGPHFIYLFIHGWTFGLFPLLDVMNVLSWTFGTNFFMDVYFHLSRVSVEDCHCWVGGEVTPCLTFWDCFPKWLHHLMFPQLRTKALISLHPPRHLLLPLIFILTILVDVTWYHVVVLTCTSLMANDIEHLRMCLFTFVLSSFVKCLVRSFAHFLVGLFIFLPGSNWVSQVAQLLKKKEKKRSASQCRWPKRRRFPIPGLGRSLGVGNGSPLPYSCLENLVPGGLRLMGSQGWPRLSEHAHRWSD